MTKAEMQVAVGLLAPFAIAGLRWAAIAVCEQRAAKAATDGRDDWEDIFWSKMLSRLSSRQYDHVKRLAKEQHERPAEEEDHGPP